VNRRGAWRPDQASWSDPGAAWRRPWHNGRRRHRRLFVRFLAGFVFAVLIFTGWIRALAFVIGRLGGVGGPTPAWSWILALLVTFSLPLAVIAMFRLTFRRLLVPLSDLIQAADTVASGDLSVQVDEAGSSGLGRLARAFNHMTAELEIADRRRRNLTADVAHELRTPLHIIQGNLEGVLDGVYEPTPAHIEATLAETRLLGRLIEDLRVLSLAEAGELPLASETVDVADLLTDVRTSFSGQAEAAGIDLRVELLAEPLAVLGDAGRLDQVFSNLVANALRYTPGGGDIVLAARALPGAVEITVRDTGRGIPEEDLPYVFDRFWRGDAARGRGTGGSGLGLAIARQLVRAHKGTIDVKSTVGEGTCFTVTLPA
jgi:two-component system, OmpR family, sensor histidine kinase BaeS